MHNADINNKNPTTIKSQRFTVALPKGTVEQLDKEAKEIGMNRNSLIALLIHEYYIWFRAKKAEAIKSLQR